MSDWAPSDDTPEGWAMLEHLRRSGTLALVDQLYDEDAAGIEREYVTVEEFIAMLEERDRP